MCCQRIIKIEEQPLDMLFSKKIGGYLSYLVKNISWFEHKKTPVV